MHHNFPRRESLGITANNVVSFHIVSRLAYAITDLSFPCSLRALSKISVPSLSPHAAWTDLLESINGEKEYARA